MPRLVPTARGELRPSRRSLFLAVGAITFVGVLLRLASLGNSLFGDEVGTYYIVTGRGLWAIVHLLDGHSVDLTPPLYYLLARVAEVFGSSPELLRIVPMLAGTAAIPLTYLVGTRTIGTRAALAAAALVALSPFLIFYSTEARAYALVMALVLGASFALLKALDDGGRRRWWVAYAGLSCAAMYTHYTAIFPLLAALVWAWFARPAARRALIGANLVAAIGFLAWLPALIKNTNSFGTKVFGILEPFNFHDVTHDLAHWSIGHPYLSLATVPGAAAVVLVLAGIALAAISLPARLRTGRATRRREVLAKPFTLAALLAAAAPVGIGLYSTFSNSVWDLRNLIVSWPGLALLAGTLLTGAERRLTLLALGLVLAGFTIGALQLLSSADQRPDYAAAARFVLHEGTPADPVAVITAPSPGPLSAIDAAFAYAGAHGRPLLRLGSAPLPAVLSAPPYALLPATPAPVLAREAASSSRARKLFVIAPGTAPLSALLGATALNGRAALGPAFGSGTSGGILATVYAPLSAFMRASLRWFRPVQTRTFPGMLRLSVYVFERR